MAAYPVSADYLRPSDGYSVDLDSYRWASRKELWELLNKVVPRLHQLQMELADVKYRAAFDLDYLRRPRSDRGEKPN
jgi:hypothetical protein